MSAWYLAAYVLPVSLLVLPIWMATRRRWNWAAIDVPAVLLPGAAWLYFVAIHGSRGRSLSNLVELPLLAVAVAALSTTKSMSNRAIPPALAKYTHLFASLAVAAAFYLCFPNMDE